jgi:hypothetical protein
VDGSAEGVEQGVDVRADPQPEERDVVAGVADDGDVGVGEARRAVEVGPESAEEPGTADAARECGDAHEAKCLRTGPGRQKRAKPGQYQRRPPDANIRRRLD